VFLLGCAAINGGIAGCATGLALAWNGEHLLHSSNMVDMSGTAVNAVLKVLDHSLQQSEKPNP
jgi:hypothetical protein